MDDIIIFSPDENSHLKHINNILKKITEAGMRISLEKCKFFRTQVEFLGFIVTIDGIRTCPHKVRDIEQFKEPKSLKSLRSFLGLSGFYRQYIKDYSKIARPVTKFLQGDNGQISAKKSKNVKIEFDQEARHHLTDFEKFYRRKM